MSAGHEVVLASAGTGKTHELSQRLLALLFAGTEPRAVLATTFTRKAAGEIAERLHERLLAALDEEQERHALPEVDGAPPTPEACAALLLALLRGGDELRIETLDAFFGRLAQAFAGELGLPPDWRIADEAEEQRLREGVLARVLADGRTDELVELLRALRGSGAEGERATHERLQGEVSQTYELWLDARAEAFAPPAPAALPGPDELERLAAELEAAPLPPNKRGQPDGRFLGARDKLLEKLAEEDWSWLVEEGLGAKALAPEPSYHGIEFPPELLAAVRAVTRAALRALRAELVRRTRAHGDLLARFHAADRAARQAAGLARFDDLPRALDAAGGLAPELLRHRTEVRLAHLLLDEFQDTSPLQWRVFEGLARPLLERDARGESSLVCVGDLKQSLYAFRGGEARLLEQLAERHELARSSLDRNWRSAPEVLRFVEHVFSRLDRCALFDDERVPGLARARATWQARWTSPVPAKAEPAGAVAVHRVPVEDAGAEERRELLATFAARRIAELRREHPRGRIGVLMRTNKPVARMLQALRAEGVPAGGVGGAPLTDSAAVRLLLSALRFAEHPGDTLARLHLERSPLGAALGVVPGLAPDAEAYDALAAALRRRWSALGAAGLVEALRAELLARDAELGTWDRVRLGQLVELAERHDALPDLRLADFLARVEQEGVPHPAAEGVQVLTIHASKGLAFDTVVLPELDAEAFKQRAGLLVHRPDPFAPIEAVWVGGKAKWMQHDEELAELLHARTAADAEGDLCALYVALTRAKTRLELVLPSPLPTRPGRTFARLLEQAGLEAWVAEGADTQDGDTADAAAGADAADAGAHTTVGAAAPAAATRESADASGADTAAIDGLGVRAGRAAEPPSAFAWAAYPERERRRGLVWHAWAERVAWLDADGRCGLDAGAARAVALAALADEGAASAELDLGAEWRRFAEALARPAVREVLTQPSGAVELWRERPFVRRGATGGAAEGRFDRVHVTRDASGRAVSAEVLDFKTGRAPRAPDDAAAAPRPPAADDTSAAPDSHDAHAEQVQQYRAALAELLELPAERVTGALLYLADGTRVDVRD